MVDPAATASAVSDWHETIRDIIAGVALAAILGIVPLIWKLVRRLELIEKHEDQLNHERNGFSVRLPQLEQDRAVHNERIQRIEDDVDKLTYGRTPPRGWRPPRGGD